MSEDVQGMIDKLSSKNKGSRKKAAEKLGDAGDPKAVEPLIACLGDKDVDVQQAAVQALGDIGDPRAVEPLLSYLDSEMTSSYTYAAGALGKIGDPRAIEPLISCLEHESEHVRSLAVDALGNIGDPRAIEPLISCLDGEIPYVRGSIRRALAKIGEPAVKPLIACFEEGDEDIRSLAAEALGNIGKPALDQLDIMLEDKDVATSSLAKQILAIIEAIFSKPPYKLPEKKDMTISTQDLKKYLDGLKDEDSSIRAEAIEALGKARAKEAVEPLIAVMRDDEDEENRQLAAMALGDIKDERAIAPLIEALDYEELFIDSFMFSPASNYAAEALKKMGAKAVIPLIKAWPEAKDGAEWHIFYTLHEIYKQVPAIKLAEDETSLWLVVNMLPRFQGVGNDEDEIIEEMMSYYADALMELCERLLGDAAPENRINAIEMLESYGQLVDDGDEVAKIYEALLPLVTDEDDGVKKAAVSALSEVREDAIEAIRDLEPPEATEKYIVALKDEDVDVVAEAVRALGELGDEKAIQPLIDKLRKDNFDYYIELPFYRVRNYVVDALISISGIAGEEIIEKQYEVEEDEGVKVWLKAVLYGYDDEDEDDDEEKDYQEDGNGTEELKKYDEASQKEFEQGELRKYTIGDRILIIDPDKCTGCGICIDECQEGCIDLGNDDVAFLAKPDKCTGCGICAENCPPIAIEME